ncbi:hypothetical protein Vafri_10744 [Volvox africanus]|uniref:Uncharacterized protein n=1 Tax=Volvox africanus TaxID=51714 RepID=A0A8J4B7T1_9CHLO|nr:hypothetical protein Vafri_10744 [Volvox africanus]
MLEEFCRTKRDFSSRTPVVALSKRDILEKSYILYYHTWIGLDFSLPRSITLSSAYRRFPPYLQPIAQDFCCNASLLNLTAGSTTFAWGTFALSASKYSAMPSWPTALGGMLFAGYAATQAQKVGIDSPTNLVATALKTLSNENGPSSSGRMSSSSSSSEVSGHKYNVTLLNH